MHGHLAARLDPLGSEPVGDPALEPERLEPKLTPELQARIPARLLRTYVAGETLADVLPQLQRDLLRHDRVRDRAHLRPRAARLAAAGDRVRPLPRAARRRRAARAARAAHARSRASSATCAAFLGQKQFSIEGLDVIVPMLDEAIELAAEAGAHEVVIGHGAPRPAERARARRRPPVRDDPARVRGRAHARGRRRRPRGRHRRRQVPPRRRRAVALDARAARSPSRSPRTRATSRRSTRSSRAARAPSRPTARPARGCTTRRVALPILIHGDASFPARASSPRRSTSTDLAGYTTGGTLHLIANNQVGFTTEPAEGRSTRYSSDLAKGFDVPIIHVNADDPEAAISADPARDGVPPPLRQRRRRRPRRLPPLRPQRAGRAGVHAAADGRARSRRTRPCASCTRQRLVEEGVVTRRRRSASSADVDGDAARGARAAEGVVRRAPRRRSRRDERAARRARRDEVVTAVAGRPPARAERASCSRVPEGFTVHPKLATPARAAPRRRSTRAGSTGATPRRSPSRRCSSTASRSG